MERIIKWFYKNLEHIKTILRIGFILTVLCCWWMVMTY